MPQTDVLIDRQALVRRHTVRLRAVDALNPLSVGNGEFAFTADVTGLQTFPEAYAAAMPLCTQSQWGWHTTPAGADVKPEAIRYSEFETFGRKVPYLTSAKGQEATFNWLRENPHRLHLGQIGLDLRAAGGAAAAAVGDLKAIDQSLDLWRGVLVSRFQFDNESVTVETCCCGETDAIAVRICSPLIADGRLAVRFAFPYGSPGMTAAAWDQPGAHKTVLTRTAGSRVDFERRLDDDRYHVALSWQGRCQLDEIAPHTFRLAADPGAACIEFVCAFSPRPIGDLPGGIDAAQARSAAMWETYWTRGAAVELAGSTDPRAPELERRIVTSQYLMKVNCAGSLPPAETGLTCNSWYGKFHLEMHWWHGVHFALWGRLPLLERSLSYYTRILPEARAIAQRQGYRGVRWPKMVDGRGIDSPSPVGPLLLWQQPHPIYYAELCYRQKPTPETLAGWREIVDETAEFMASLVVRDDKSGKYVIGPPMKAVQENNDTNNTWNPTFELTYWRFGLETAQRWRERLGEPRHGQWDAVLRDLAPLPQKDGLYLYNDGFDETYTTWNWEHPAVVGAMGMLNGDGVDRETMRRSVEKTMSVWQWDRCWGWDFPMTAMAAARCGRPDLAIDALFIASKKNTYGVSGHVYQRPSLPLYLPANGGLLAAIAMMAGGWDGAPDRTAPGFPETGWTVRSEGLHRLP
ncbi:MAG TPA: hypothetical protein VF624_02070 [Tepidisphaeraceae bacterium]|jgi:hypothetical protein